MLNLKNKTQWVQEKLAEHGYDKEPVMKLYPEFVKAYGPTTITSYKTTVRRELRVFKEQIDPKTEKYLKDAKSKEAEDEATLKSLEKKKYSKYKPKEMIGMLYKHTRNNKRRLTTQDLYNLSVKYNIKYSDWNFIVSEDISQFISDIYSELFETKDHLKETFELKDNIKQLQKVNSKLIKDYSFEEKILSKLDKIAIEYAPLPCNIKLSNNNKRKKETLLLLSDAHFEETVNPQDIMFLNKYNTQVARRRLTRVFEEMIEYSLSFQSDVLNIHLLGDLLSGLIHEELKETNSLTISASVLQLIDLLAQLIRNAKKHFKEVKIVSVVGNHSRFDQKIHYKNAAVNNFEYLLYSFLAKELKHIVTKFVNPTSKFWIDNILGYNFYVTHGDEFKGGTGFSPIPTTSSRDAAKIASMFRNRKLKSPKDIHYFCMAHFHTPMENISFDGVPIMFNGSISGANEFSVNKLKRATAPAQNMYVVEHKKGVSIKHTINLEEVF